MAGEGFAELAVDQEADSPDGGKVLVECADDREQGQGLGFDARGMVFGEGAGQVNDRSLGPESTVDGLGLPPAAGVKKTSSTPGPAVRGCLESGAA